MSFSGARRFTFITGNPKKLEEVKAILGDSFEIVNQNLDLPEIQGDPIEVAKEKCQVAAKLIGGPVLVEDTSLCFNALGELPGVYIRWFFEKLKHDGLNRMLAGFEDRTAYAQCIFAYSAGEGEEPIVFQGRVDGTIVPSRGPLEFGWDSIFEPIGFKDTFAEMDKSVKNGISHRSRALDKLREFFVV